jgi:ABC-type multidrug transport system ATPase subunit
MEEIRANNLTFKNFEKTVLSGAIFSCPIGARTALVGPAGSGKKALLLMLGGFLKPSSGSVTVNGKDIFKEPANYRKKVSLGAIDKINPLCEEMTVRENLIFASEMAGARCREENIMKMSHGLELEAFLDTPVKELPSFQAAVASIACALVAETEILILDEPTIKLMSLDADKFWEIIGSRLIGKTVIFSTKNMEEAEKHADRIVLLRNGQAVVHTV